MAMVLLVATPWMIRALGRSELEAVIARLETPEYGGTVEEFLALPHLSFRLAGPDNGSIAENYLTQAGYERRIVASTESFATAPFLLRGTSLVTLVPRRLGERLQHAADIRLLEVPLDVPPLRETLIWSPRFTASAAHAWLRTRLVDVAKSL